MHCHAPFNDVDMLFPKHDDKFKKVQMENNIYQFT